MIEFLKERRIVIIIILLAIILIGWKMYDSSKYGSIDNNDLAQIEQKNTEDQEEEIVVVHVTGEIKKPGVVKVKEGSRVEDIIEAAGGITENADISNINLAYIVEDGTKIRIPSTDDEKNNEYMTQNIGEGIIMQEDNKDSNSSIININTASETELEELPGIGAAIAERIIDYRNKNGKFKNIEDIKNVPGIGDSKFEKIKNLIKIK